MEGSGSEKTNALINLIDHKLCIYEIYLYARDPYDAKYQSLIKKHEVFRLKFLKNFLKKLLLNTQMI